MLSGVAGGRLFGGRRETRITGGQARISLAMLLDLEAQVRDHLPGVLIGLPGLGEITGDEDRVRRIKRQRLEGTQMRLPPGRDPDLLAWVEEPHQTENAQAVVRLEVV